jgi:hypothetical protein
MAIFGFYFVSGLLREAGWPRKQGLFRKDVLDTTILDSAIDQMVDWAASLGAGRPALALQIVAEMFRDRDWESDNGPNIKKFVEGARAEKDSWRVTDAIAPHDVVQPTRFAGMGPTVDAKALTDERMRLGLEQWLLEGVLWGLGNPKAFETWYRSHTEHHMKNLEFMQQAGLAVEAPLDLQQFFANSEDLVRSYERDVGPLGAIPERLRADARALGRDV